MYQSAHLLYLENVDKAFALKNILCYEEQKTNLFSATDALAKGKNGSY